MKIGAVNWKLREIAREEEFYEHLRELLDKCKGCDVIVLPELFALELLAVHPPESDNDIPGILAPYFEPILGVLSDWTSEHRPRFLAGGSNITEGAPFGVDTFINSSPNFFDRIIWQQDKIMVTEWEKSVGIEGSEHLEYTSDSLCGVTICLDAEFPASGRALAEAGMLFQCVPAWTETMHGFRRVRWACQARAVENQVCVIHSSLVGRVGNEESHGSSAIICPPHEPFPLNPILSETAMDEEGVAIAEVDPNDLLKCREMGEVRNWRDRDAGYWTVSTS